MTREELNEIKEEIEDIDLTNSSEYLFEKLYEIADDNSDFQEAVENRGIFDDFIDRDTLEEMAKHELNEGGLDRLYAFMPEDYGPSHDYFRIDGYGNCQNIDTADIENLKSELLDCAEDLENELEDEVELS